MELTARKVGVESLDDDDDDDDKNDFATIPVTITIYLKVDVISTLTYCDIS